jgi:hypothetical protein
MGDDGADGELGDRLAVKYGMLLAHLDERARRLYLGSEALALEAQGLDRERAVRVVAGAAGVSRATVRAGADELAAGAEPLGRVRRPGAGRPRAEDADPGFAAALEALISDDCRGDPMSPLKWTARSAESLARTLTLQGTGAASRRCCGCCTCWITARRATPRCSRAVRIRTGTPSSGTSPGRPAITWPPVTR